MISSTIATLRWPHPDPVISGIYPIFWFCSRASARGLAGTEQPAPVIGCSFIPTSPSRTGADALALVPAYLISNSNHRRMPVVLHERISSLPNIKESLLLQALWPLRRSTAPNTPARATGCPRRDCGHRSHSQVLHYTHNRIISREAEERRCWKNFLRTHTDTPN